jgi:methylmalonyl-CoA/ethylmalonyl-CoA epimerase
MDTIGNPWTRLTHIGVVVRELDAAVTRYLTLGAGPFKRFCLPSDEFIKPKWRQHFGKPADDFRYEIAYGQMGPIGVEVFQCISGDTIPQRFLDAKGEGVWHYGYDVEDMDQTIEWMTRRGFQVIGASETVEGTRMSYFGTDDIGGIYWQAHEIPAGSKEALLMGAVVDSPR